MSAKWKCDTVQTSAEPINHRAPRWKSHMATFFFFISLSIHKDAPSASAFAARFMSDKRSWTPPLASCKTHFSLSHSDACHSRVEKENILVYRIFFHSFIPYLSISISINAHELMAFNGKFSNTVIIYVSLFSTS